MTGSGGAQLRSVNCTQCGAPLTLHGGHRVESITCGYCGSVLDTHEDYKVIRTYADLQRPVSPLAIGMSGELKGVRFTIIGMVQYHDEWNEAWLEYAIFSPTHGYAWLEQDSGHFVFSRRVRDVPDTPIVRHTKARFDASGHTFRVFARYRAQATFVEGELPYVASLGDSVQMLDAVAPPYIYTVETTGSEVEYVLGEYLPADTVYEAFGLDDEPYEPRGVHPAQPYRPSGFTQGLWTSGLVFAPIALVLLLYTVFLGSGSVVLSGNMAPTRHEGNVAVAERSFALSAPGDLLKLDMRMSRFKGWGSFDVRVLQGGEQVYSLDEHLKASGASYGGRSYWAVPRTSVASHFRLPAAGQYTLQVLAKIAPRQRRAAANMQLPVTLRQGVKLSRYYFALLCMAGVAFLAGPLALWRFEARRWSESDEHDD